MNFKDFKKVEVTKTHTVFKHPDGHLIHIANDKIPASLRKEMRDIPSQSAMERLKESRKPKKMADGGGVPLSELTPDYKEQLLKEAEEQSKLAEQTRIAEEAKQLQEQKRMRAGQQAAEYFGTEQFPELKKFEAPKPMPAQSAYENVPVEEQAPEAPVEPEVPFEQTPEGKAAATAERGQQMLESVPYQQDQQAVQIMEEMQKTVDQAEQQKILAKQEFDKATEPVIKYMDENKINPNRILGQMDTMDRIQQAIAFMLGGAGAGLAGTENYAWKAFQNAIDRDVKAQEEDIASQKNIMAAYEKVYKNRIDAIDATKAFAYKVAALKTQQLASQSNSKIVAGKAMMQSQKMLEESKAAVDRIAARQTVRQAEQQFASGAVQSEQQVAKIIRAIPNKQEQQDVWKAYTTYGGTLKSIEDFKNKMNQAYQVSRVGAKALSPIQSSKILATINAELVPSIKKLLGESRFTDNDVKVFVKPFQVGTLTSYDTVQKQIKNLQDSLITAMEPEAIRLRSNNIVAPRPVTATKRDTIK